MSVQSEKLLRAIGELDEELVKDAAPLEALPQTRGRRGVRGVIAAAVAAALLVGTAFAARELFGSWIVTVEHDGAYYTQKAYTDVRCFTADDFTENILFSPEGDGFWYVGLDSWDEMEDYLGWPLTRNFVLENSPAFLSGAGELARCSIQVRYCEHGERRNAYRYTPAGRDMSPYADQLEYITVQSSHLVDGAMVTLFGTFYTGLELEHDPYPFPFHGEEFPAGSLTEQTLANGAKAVVFHPERAGEAGAAARPSAWFVYEGGLYYIFLSEAPEQYVPENGVDLDAVLAKVLEGFR